jgi:hypothetical protein
MGWTQFKALVTRLNRQKETRMFHVWVLTQRSGSEMQVAVDFPESWSELTSQEIPANFALLVAQGQIVESANFDVLALGTYPGIPEPAVTQTCLLGYEVANEFDEIYGGNMESQVGADRDIFLAFFNNKWQARYTALRDSTTNSMTRRAFMEATVAVLNTVS